MASASVPAALHARELEAAEVVRSARAQDRVDLLAPGGRLLVPLTLARGPDRMKGVLLGVTRSAEGYRARIVSALLIFPCSGAAEDDEADAALRQACGARAMWDQIRSVRRDPHAREPECWLHGRDLCVSTRAPGG